MIRKKCLKIIATNFISSKCSIMIISNLIDILSMFFSIRHMYDLNPLDESVGKTIVSLNCQLITLMDVIPGKIELTSSYISFYDESNESLFGSGCDFRFALEKLQEMHMRRYNLRKTGLEFFLIDRSSYLINFPDFKVCEKFL